MPESAREQFEAQRAELQKELERIAPQSLSSCLGAMISLAIIIQTIPTKEELPMLSSKFGGTPDVPVGFEWPLYKERPLWFVAQINLEQLAPFDAEDRLPKSGLLSFWINEECDIDEKFGGWRVFHFEDNEKFASLIEHSQGESFPPAPLQFEVRASVPNVLSCADFYDEDKVDDHDLAYAVSEAFASKGGHQMFGFAYSVQNDVRYEAAPQWNKFLSSPATQEFGLSRDDETDWRDWELLLQMDGDLNAQMEWGDSGAIYFLMRRVDLQARRFDRAWFVFQCC